MKSMLDDYITVIKHENKKEVVTEGASEVIGKVRDFLRHHSPRRIDDINKIKEDFHKTMDACTKYYVRIDNEEKVTGKSRLTAIPNAEVGWETKIKTSSHPAFYKCKIMAHLKYYSAISSLLERTKIEVCASNSNRDKCYKWVEKKIKEYKDGLRYAMISKDFM